jgi:ornithine carbamoyltransferase
MEATALTGMRLTIACPSGYRPSPAAEISTRHLAKRVVDEVIDAPTSAVWQQAANRLYSEQALLYRLILGS